MKNRKLLIVMAFLLLICTILYFKKLFIKDTSITSPVVENISNTQTNSVNTDSKTTEPAASNYYTELSDTMSNLIGISAGNLMNGGNFTAQGNWMYYAPTRYYNNGTSLIRSMLDGETAYKDLQQTNKIKFAASCVNVVGEWIYFIDQSDGNLIFKTKIDGSNIQLVVNESAFQMCVIDNYIYFFSPGGLKRVKTDGTMLETLYTPDDILYSFSFDSNHLYLLLPAVLEQNKPTGKLYKINLNGSGLELITDKENFVFFIPYNDWIYFIDNNSRYLYKIKQDGSSKTKVLNDTLDCFNISDGYIYYTTLPDRNKLYRVNLNGSNKTNLTKNLNSAAISYILSINIIGDYNYCLFTDDNGINSVLRVKNDGSLVKSIY